MGVLINARITLTKQVRICKKATSALVCHSFLELQPDSFLSFLSPSIMYLQISQLTHPSGTCVVIDVFQQYNIDLTGTSDARDVLYNDSIHNTQLMSFKENIHSTQLISFNGSIHKTQLLSGLTETMKYSCV